MKCDLCHQPTAGVCTRPHDAKAVARWMDRNVERPALKALPERTPNVEHIDEPGGVTFVVHGVATCTVRNGFPGKAIPRRDSLLPALGRTVAMPNLGLSEPPISMCPRCAVRLDDVYEEEPYCPKCAWTPAMAVSHA